MANDADEFDQSCKTIGELIIWANMIDLQLNLVVASALALPDHRLVDGIVAQFDARPKLELLRTRMKLLPTENAWRVNILAWLLEVEKVNEHRNIVAHHCVKVKDGKVRLVTSQLNKILRSIGSTMKPKPNKGLKDIQKWVADAAKAFDAGTIVVENAAAFRSEVERRDRKKTKK